MVQGTAIVTRRDVGSIVVVPVGRRRVSLKVESRMVGHAFATVAAPRARGYGAPFFRLKKKEMIAGRALVKVVKEAQVAFKKQMMIARRALVMEVKVTRATRSRPRAEEAVRTTTTDVVTTAQMLEAGLLAFQEIATRWQLTNGEQSGVLQVSESSLLRWKKAPPSDDEVLLDRLQLVLLAYQRVNELAGSELEAAALVRREGSALNPENLSQTVLQMLSVPSILEMNRHVQRLDAEVHAW